MRVLLITSITILSLVIIFFSGASGVSVTSISLHILLYFSACAIGRLKALDAFYLAITAWFATSAVTYFFLGSRYGYAGIFTVMILINHLLGAFVGCLLGNSLVRSEKKSIYFYTKVFSFVVVVGILLGTLLHRNSIHNKAEEAARKRYNLLHRIAYAIRHETLSTISTQSVIEAGLADGIYTISPTSIIHTYGGDIEVKIIDAELHVVYKNYPVGIPCDNQFFVERPIELKFKGTFIEGNSSSEKDKYLGSYLTGKKYCFDTGTTRVNIAYTALYENLVDENFKPTLPN